MAHLSKRVTLNTVARIRAIEMARGSVLLLAVAASATQKKAVTEGSPVVKCYRREKLG